ncbi:MAG: hypothetical protein F6K47_21980 [Symploca sp. SIO2E6]|nr:hypothetical protein [Symploca sp. SIO2E6]
MFGSKLKFFRWLVLGLIGLLALWMIGGNLLASHLEKEIDKEIEQKIKELAEAYPDPEPNDSALKLDAILSSEFGMKGVVGRTYYVQGVFKFGDYIGAHPDFNDSTNNHEQYNQISEQLSQYIDSQISKPNDDIDSAPRELQIYLESKADALIKVHNYVVNRELPKTETLTDDLFELPSVGLPLHLSLANFQKVLALDILEKQRQGKNQEAREMLYQIRF